MSHARQQARRPRHAARARRAHDAGGGGPPVLSRPRLRERGPGDLGAGQRSGPADGARAAADRGDRQEHRREDPRAARKGEGREAGGAPAEAPAQRGGAAADPGPGPEGAQAAARRAGRAVDRRSAPRAGRAEAARARRGSARSQRRSWPSPWRASRRRGRWSGRRSRWRCRSPSGSWPHMRELPGVTHASTCGSLRRFSETVGDVDIMVAAAAAEPVMEALVSMSLVDRVLGRGESKTSVVTRRGTQIDLRVVAEKQLGAALLYFTGSKGHNIKLRMRALARGLDAQRVRAVRDRRRPRRRQRDRGADLRARSSCPSSRPSCARTPARSRRPRRGRCRRGCRR